MKPQDLQHIFHPNLGLGGLRGSPYLWQELEQVFAHLQLPTSAAAMDGLLLALYQNLVGEPLAPDRRPVVPRLEHGGMSSGQIDSNFWLERGFPVLKSRMLELLPPGAASPKDSAQGASSRAALLGLAVGDALGVPVEFQSRTARRSDPVVGMRAYGTHGQPAGTWSDDASLTFCLAEAIAEGFTLEKVARNCTRWYFDNFWTPHGQVFDVGIATREALQRLRQNPDQLRAGGTDEMSNGNGSLMRILPLAFFGEDAPLTERFQLIHDVSAVTHGHIRSAVACLLYLEVVRYLRAGLSPTQAYSQLCQEAPAQLRALNIPSSELTHFERILGGRLASLPESSLASGGYVLHTLEAALWCLLHYDTFAATVLAAVNLGDDTDTTGAVAGGLAGLYYGEGAIPGEWLQVLARRSDIEELAFRMASNPSTSDEGTRSNVRPPRPLPNSYWATPAVLGCEYPGDRDPQVARAKLTTLLDAGITDFFDLTEPHELKPYEALLLEMGAARGRTVQYHRFPIRDVDVPTSRTLEGVLSALTATVAAGRKAAVHCWGGVGRTGTVLGCYLVRDRQLTGEQALAHIATEWKGVAKSERKPNSPETAAQRQFVQDFS